MPKLTLTLFVMIIIFLLSCSRQVGKELTGLWLREVQDSGEGFYITYEGEKYILHPRWGDIGKGDFFLNIAGNTITYYIATHF